MSKDNEVGFAYKPEPSVYQYDQWPVSCDNCRKFRFRCTQISVGLRPNFKTLTLCPDCFEALLQNDSPLLSRWYRALYRLNPKHWANTLKPWERWTLSTARACSELMGEFESTYTMSTNAEMMRLIAKLADLLDERIDDGKS